MAEATRRTTIMTAAGQPSTPDGGAQGTDVDGG
jgi:hypothetical protein